LFYHVSLPACLKVREAKIISNCGFNVFTLNEGGNANKTWYNYDNIICGKMQEANYRSYVLHWSYTWETMGILV